MVEPVLRTLLVAELVMCKAWPRFLPEPNTDAIAHALIIDAYAIVVEQLADGHASLGEAHDGAVSYAETHYSADEVRTAREACAADPDNQTARLPLLLGIERFEEEPVRTAA
jgi:hypothetical protein